MTRKETTVTERLNELYKERAFLKTKLGLQIETFNRTKAEMHQKAETKTFCELDVNQAVIDRLLEDM